MPMIIRPAVRSARNRQRGAAGGWVFLGFLAIAAFFLLTEHRAHMLGALPFVLLALCPLMHLFHGRHGGDGHGGHAEDRSPDAGASGGSPPANPHRH